MNQIETLNIVNILKRNRGTYYVQNNMIDHRVCREFAILQCSSTEYVCPFIYGMDINTGYYRITLNPIARKGDDRLIVYNVPALDIVQKGDDVYDAIQRFNRNEIKQPFFKRHIEKIIKLD